MSDKPIIFSGPMVRAIIEGRKSQTRRLLRPQPLPGWQYQGRNVHGQAIFYPPDSLGMGGAMEREYDKWNGLATLPYAKGDRLWVRETWASHTAAGRKIYLKGDHHPWGSPIYRATFSAALDPKCEGFSAWRSPIHMPRWASRLTLTVTDVRVQRVQEISEDDAAAEGCRPFFDYDNPDSAFGVRMVPWRGPLDLFRDLWNSINAKRGHSWESNPWVVAITFTAEQRNIDDERTAA